MARRSNLYDRRRRWRRHRGDRRWIFIGLSLLFMGGLGWLGWLYAHGSSGVVNAARWNNLAIHGYDPVAYFNERAPRKGSPQFELEWLGATWRFVSAENRERFTREARRYTPAYGGYSAYDMALGYLEDSDPTVFDIMNGRLFLNSDDFSRQKWLDRMPAIIRQADREWVRTRERLDQPDGPRLGGG